MSARQLVEITAGANFAALARQRSEQLGVTRAALDAVAGLSSGYAGKCLSKAPRKRFGVISLIPAYNALGMRIMIFEDSELLRRYAARLGIEEPPQPAEPPAAPSESEILRKHLSKIGRRGGKAPKTQRLTAEERSARGRKAVLVRWAKHKNASRAAG